MIKYQNYNFDNKITDDDILCLDIEVSSFWVNKGKVYSYDATLSDSFYNESDKGSLCYIWMLGVNNKVYYGRELSELKPFLDKLQETFIYNEPRKGKDREHPKHIIWIHNLAYEYQFLINYLEFDSVFARSVRKPIKAIYQSIEFRCTYQLTHMSLAKWSESTNVKKLVGNLDYRLLLTPKSKLTKEQLDYCKHDILVMYEGLYTYINRYNSQRKIPLTQTGEVRKAVKETFAKDYNYHKLCTKLIPDNAEEYRILRKAFGGGDTHANIIYANQVLYDIGSYDETSAYPGVLFRKRFPITKFILCSKLDRDFDFDKYAYIFGISLTNVRAKGNHHYIARSRMVSVTNGICENGRLVSADIVTGYITEQDKIIIDRFYDYDSIEYISVRKSVKGYLNKKYIDLVLEYFKNKNTLKGVDDDLYMLSKQLLNSLYGMQVTDLINQNIEWNTEQKEWIANRITEEQITNTLLDLKDKKKMYRNFVSFQHGVYVTAYARAELWEMIWRIDGNNKDNSIVYYDTDSLKYKHPLRVQEYFNERNKEIIEENKKAAKHYGYKEDVFIATDPKGKIHTLGVWESENDKDTNIAYNEFKTLGAKKYCYSHNGTIGITVAGVPKVASKLVKHVYDFKRNFVFDRETCEKNMVAYIDGTNPLVKIKGYQVKETYGINIRNNGYTLNITNDFAMLIEHFKEKGWFIE